MQILKMRNKTGQNNSNQLFMKQLHIGEVIVEKPVKNRNQLQIWQ